ncbi:MAG: MtnX-like HAD-IB family phosphatase [Methanomassiliicoccales archaeon]|nr:MtnX-like HAD-IB family phosphatase [Methanomassiliicoccales archaeon]
MCGKCSLLNPKTAEWVSKRVRSDADRVGSKGLVVLCDFDGTITSFDTADYILRRFAEGDWEQYDRLLGEGKISLEECMVRQFGLVHVPEAIIIDELEKVACVRPNFSELVHFCHREGIPFYIVSAGLDFVIYHYLDKMGLRPLIKMHSGTSFFDGKKINFSFPQIVNLEAQSFKDDLVKTYQRRGMNVAYIGDGLSDLVAAKLADIRFAVSGMRLERTLKEAGLAFESFEDFAEVERGLRSHL